MEVHSKHEIPIFMGCIDARKGIFNTFLAVMDRQSCTDEIYWSQINWQEHIKFEGWECYTPLYPPLAMPW